MSIKPNSILRVPGPWVATTMTQFKPNGVPSYDTEIRSALSSVTLRTTSGVSRHNPKDGAPTNYSANYQRSGARHRFFYELQDTPLVYQTLYGGGPALNSLAGGFELYPTPSWTHLENEALNKLSDVVRGDLDLGVDIAQAGQTAKMMHATDRLHDYVKTFARKGSRLKALINGVSNARLEWAYGVKPLVGSIYGAADEAIRVVINKVERFTATSSKTVEFEKLGLNTVVGLVDFPIRDQFFRMHVKYGVSLFNPEHDWTRWTSVNPFSFAWEFLPYSFVVDWVWNVGGYLRTMETGLLSNSRFRHGYRTRFIRGTAIGFWPDGNWTCSGTTSDMNRLALTAYPLPSLPRFEADLGSSRLLNLAGLLGGLLRR